MTEKRKTVCIGRYLVDVPDQAELSFSGGVLDGFDIDTVEESETDFRQRVTAREAEIVSRGPATDGSGGIVDARDLRIPGMTGRTLLYGRNRGYWFEGGRRIDDEWLSVEIHAHIEGVSFSLSAKSADEARAAVAEALLGRLRLRREGEIPTVQGFCISRAIFVEPLPAHKSEHLIMHVGLPDHPDMAVTLASIAGASPGPGLLERVAQTEATIGADVRLRMSKLREGKRVINEINGEEVLVRAREINFSTTYGFTWDAPGKQDDLHKPYLSLELQTGINERPGGKPVDTSLHEDALLTLWDTIASSIRLRKNGPPPSSALPPEPSGPKLGAVANAGENCPQSGWWRCNEGGPGLAVHGGQVQFIRKGQRMPQALLLPRQTLWQKLKRIQASVETNNPTAWTLADRRQRPRVNAAVMLAAAGEPSTSVGRTAGDAATVVLGTYVRTGDPCPASGWWCCEEAHALDGTRWFAQGSLMPAATFQVPAGVFAKSAGPEVIQRRSGWQLMRHADSPSLLQPAHSICDGLLVDEPPTLV